MINLALGIALLSAGALLIGISLECRRLSKLLERYAERDAWLVRRCLYWRAIALGALEPDAEVTARVPRVAIVPPAPAPCQDGTCVPCNHLKVWGHGGA